MSFSGTLSSAMSGLTTAARAAELVSSNISNAMTEGYGRKELSVSARHLGGVKIDSVIRHEDPRLSFDVRQARAENGGASTTHDFLMRLEAMYGVPGEAGALNTLFNEFDARLISAAANPGSNQRLELVKQGAQEISNKLNSLSKGIQSERKAAEFRINGQVSELNSKLEEVHKLNIMIAKSEATQRDAFALYDSRQRLVDDISSIIPIRVVDRQHGRIALFTNGGAVILDSAPAEFVFTPANEIVPHMTLAGGLLSGLTMNDKPISTSITGPLAGGSLIANFDIRDRYAPEAQTQLDAAARNLIERFQSGSVDPTLGVADAGLFTDAGTQFDAVNEIGISDRIEINAMIDPDKGGALWRLRDGLSAASAGDVGNATILQNYSNAITQPNMLASGTLAGSNMTMADVFTTLTSDIALAATTLETRQSYATARLVSLEQQQRANGVDTDQELQNLMLIEKSFAANARVLQTVDELMQTLLRM